MSLRLTTGTLLLLLPVALMAYTVYTLAGLPYVYTPLLLWLAMAEYAMGRAWWDDVCEVRSARQARM